MHVLQENLISRDCGLVNNKLSWSVTRFENEVVRLLGILEKALSEKDNAAGTAKEEKKYICSFNRYSV